jgi:DNA repair exonuclease SbcCD ATPase subunit
MLEPDAYLPNSIESLPTERSATAESEGSMIEKFETSVRNQLQSLRSEVQDREKLLVEHGKAHQLADTLKGQLEVEQQKYQQLDESCGVLRQTEADLKSHVKNLEQELENAKAMACRHDSDPQQLEQTVQDLHLQLEQARQESEAATEKLEQSEHHRKQLEKELSKYKVRTRPRPITSETHTMQEDVEACKAKLFEVAKEKVRLRVESSSSYLLILHRKRAWRNSARRLRPS